MFFDFAPIFAVPAYMEEPCSALERIEQYDSNYTYYEHEVMANALGYESFAHEDSHTEAILKTGVVSKQDGKDLITRFGDADPDDLLEIGDNASSMAFIPVRNIMFISRRQRSKP